MQKDIENTDPKLQPEAITEGKLGEAAPGTPAVARSTLYGKVKRGLLHGVTYDIHKVIEEDDSLRELHGHAEVFEPRIEMSFSYLQVKILLSKRQNNLEVDFTPFLWLASGILHLKLAGSLRCRVWKVKHRPQDCRATIHMELGQQMTLKLKNYGRLHDKQICAVPQVFSACCVIFAHGAGEVGYMAGPLTTVWEVYKNGFLSKSANPPIWIILIGAIGLVVGLATYGYKVTR